MALVALLKGLRVGFHLREHRQQWSTPSEEKILKQVLEARETSTCRVTRIVNPRDMLPCG